MVPKLADFGLSKLFGEEQTRITQSRTGTLGYMPPEYLLQNVVSKKSDIFSLGVVMTKIIAGPSGLTSGMNCQEFLNHVQENWRKRLQVEWSSPEPVKAQCQQVKTCIKIALACMEMDRHKRPSIMDIILKLSETEVSIEEIWRSPQDETPNDLLYSNPVDDAIAEWATFCPFPMSISFHNHFKLSINSGSIDRIPRLIGCLDQLETLDLSGSQTVTVYKEVLLLPKLKHLLGMFQLARADMFSLSTLGLFETGLERFLRNKSKLETLEGFVIGRSYGFPQLMSLMRRLRKVKIWCEPNAIEKNLMATSNAITKFICDGVTGPDLTRSLSVDFEASSGEFVNEVVPAAGGKLNSLELRGKLSQFPPFVARLSDIEELCLGSTGLSWEQIRDGLSNVRGLRNIKLFEDNLGRFDILPEAEHLKAVKRIYVLCRGTLEVTITSVALPQLVSLHIICEDLHFIPDNFLIEMTRMTKLKEVALHHQVQSTIRAGLVRAAYAHHSRPDVLFLEYPPKMQTS